MSSDITTSNNAQTNVLSYEEWSGPWGVIEPVPQSVDTLCVQIDGDEGRPCVYYYPYRTIAKWNWRMDEPESLTIEVGNEEIAIFGKGLRRLAEALNAGQLKLLQLSTSSYAGGAIAVQAIRFNN
jgi:hypothetical protein